MVFLLQERNEVSYGTGSSSKLSTLWHAYGGGYVFLRKLRAARRSHAGLFWYVAISSTSAASSASGTAGAPDRTTGPVIAPCVCERRPAGGVEDIEATQDEEVIGESRSRAGARCPLAPRRRWSECGGARFLCADTRLWANPIFHHHDPHFHLFSLCRSRRHA